MVPCHIGVVRADGQQREPLGNSGAVLAVYPLRWPARLTRVGRNERSSPSRRVPRRTPRNRAVRARRRGCGRGRCCGGWFGDGGVRACAVAWYESGGWDRVSGRESADVGEHAFRRERRRSAGCGSGVQRSGLARERRRSRSSRRRWHDRECIAAAAQCGHVCGHVAGDLGGHTSGERRVHLYGRYPTGECEQARGEAVVVREREPVGRRYVRCRAVLVVRVGDRCWVAPRSW